MKTFDGHGVLLKELFSFLRLSLFKSFRVCGSFSVEIRKIHDDFPFISFSPLLQPLLPVGSQASNVSGIFFSVPFLPRSKCFARSFANLALAARA